MENLKTAALVETAMTRKSPMICRKTAILSDTWSAPSAMQTIPKMTVTYIFYKYRMNLYMMHTRRIRVRSRNTRRPRVFGISRFPCFDEIIDVFLDRSEACRSLIVEDSISVVSSVLFFDCTFVI